MESITLDLDFLVGPIVKDYFDTSKNILITGISLIDDNKEINDLNDKISYIYSSFYDFDTDVPCRFNIKKAKEAKPKLDSLLKQLISKLNEINDGSFVIDNKINLDF